MARGGKRPGAGRKKGAATVRTREIADRMAAEGKMPLEVMLETMRDLWSRGKRMEAATLAKDAAPYVHPRLSNVEAKHTHDFSGLSDAELAAELLALRGRALVALGAGSGEAEEAPARAH